ARRPADTPVAEPTGPAGHAVRARNRSLRIDATPARQTAGPPILTPLPDIPMHVIQSPRGGQLLPHRVRRTAAVVEIPRVVRQVSVARVIPIAKPRRGPPPTRILPLRLR